MNIPQEPMALNLRNFSMNNIHDNLLYIAACVSVLGPTIGILLAIIAECFFWGR